MASSVEAPRPVGEECLQMWDLNKRLEAYLARVQFLEEENEALKSELQRRRRDPPESSWRAKCEAEVAALRAARDEALRERSVAELARAGLRQELQQVARRWQKARCAQAEAKQLLATRKSQLEDQRRGHIWLRGKAAQLAEELHALGEAQREERAGLGQELLLAGAARGLEASGPAPGTLQPAEVEDYSRRLSDLWRGAAEAYKAEVSQLERFFGEAKANLGKASESNRQSQLQLRHLERELAGLRRQKEALEERLGQQWQRRQAEAEKLQLSVEQLEEQRQSLTAQIAQVLEDRQQLMHLKMSLSLEVATYRTLLEAESTRLQMPAEHPLAIVSSHDVTLEASNTKRQAVSPERGHLGSQDLQPNPTIFLKGIKTPQLPKNQNGSFAVTLASGLPKSRSPVVHEFQKANAVLQSQSAKVFDMVDEAPGFLDPAAFQLSSSPQEEVVSALPVVTVFQSPVHEPCPPLSSHRPTVPDVLGESSPDGERSHHIGEGGDEDSAQRRAEELGEKAKLQEGGREEEEEVEEEEPREEPPSPQRTTEPHGPAGSQLAMEAASGPALQDVQEGGDACVEAATVNVAGFPQGLPPGDSSFLEDEARAVASPSPAAALEEATRLPLGSQADLLGGTEDLEGSREANSSQEAGPELAKEVGGGVTLDAEPHSAQEAALLEEERSCEEMALGLPVPEEMACDDEMGALGQEEGGHRHPPSLQSLAQADAFEEVFQGLESASPPDKDVGVLLRAPEDGSKLPGPGHPADPAGPTEADFVDTEGGGGDDPEREGTDPLQLSEGEERRSLSSPSRESEDGDFQVEMLGSEFPRTEEFATESLLPLSHSFYSAENHVDYCFLGVEQETSEEQTPLHETDSALPEEVRKEMDSEPETSSAEEARLSGDEDAAGTFSAEAMAGEEAGAEEDWVPEQDVWGENDLFEEESEEDTAEKKEISDQEMANLQGGTSDEELVLQQKGVESVLEQEASKGERREESAELLPRDLPTEQEKEEDKVAMAPPETESLAREERITGSGAREREEEEVEEAKAGLAEKDEATGDAHTSGFQEEEIPEAKEADSPETEEQHVAAETEETCPNQDALRLGQSLPQETGTAALEVPSAAPSNTADGREAEPHSDPPGTDVSSESDHRLQGDYPGPEVFLESLGIPPNVSHEAEGIEKDLESSKQIKLEETLPDSTPLHLYDEMMSALTGDGQLLPGDDKAGEMPLPAQDRRTSTDSVEPSVEEEEEEVGPYSSPTESHDAKERAGADEGSGRHAAPAAMENAHSSEKLLMDQDGDEAECISDNGDPLPTRQPEMLSTEEDPAQLEPELNEQPGEILNRESGAIEGPPCGEMLQEETGSTDFVWETKRDGVFRAPDPSSVQKEVHGEIDRPLELSDPSQVESAGPRKVSPLTSVADLGEIVLEGEQSPGDLKDGAASEDQTYGEDKSLLSDHESQPTSDLDNCGREDLTPHTDGAGLNASGQEDFTDPSPTGKASLPTDTLKDSDILEIVEQALEFNQEFIKAAEQTVEMEPEATCGDIPHSTKVAEGDCRSVASPDVGRVPGFTETPDAPSHSAKDPTGYGLLWAENCENGLQQDSSLADVTCEILNGLGDLHSGNSGHEVGPSREELIEEVTNDQDSPEGGLDDPVKSGIRDRSPHDEAPRSRGTHSEIHQNISMEHKGQEGLNVDKDLFLAPVKGKDAKMETISIPTRFGEEILHQESSQHQKFPAEDEDESWSPEDN